MFILNDHQNGLRSSDGEVVSLLHSINEPRIAAADRPAEATKAFICTTKDSKGHLRAHIILYLTSSGMRVMYSWDGDGFKEADRDDIEAEALDFVENMGFMMDSFGLGKTNGKGSVRDLPIFEGASHADKSVSPEIDMLRDMEAEPSNEEGVIDLDDLMAEVVEENPLVAPAASARTDERKIEALENSDFQLDALEQVEESVAAVDASEESDIFSAVEDFSGPSISELEQEFSRAAGSDDVDSLVSGLEEMREEPDAEVLEAQVAEAQIIEELPNVSAPAGDMKRLVRLLAGF